MAYGIKYQNITTSIEGDSVTVNLLKQDYAGAVLPFTMPLDALRIERSSTEQRLYGVFGTVARVITVGLDPAEFVVNQFTEWRCDVYVGSQLTFTGYIVLDDITTELRVQPVQMELIFTDNLGLLSDTPAPFEIDVFFTPAIEIIAECINATGLELPISTFLSIYPSTGDNLTGTLSQIKLIPRTWASSLTEWKSCKQALDDILLALRCRLYQHNGEWVIFRTHDLLNAGPVYSGFKYAYGTLSESDTTIDTATSGLTFLGFTQQVTHKRALRQVRDTYTFDAGFQLLNADLQTLGALQSSTVVGPNTVSRYDATYWTNVNGQTSYIEVTVDTATGAEIERSLVLPFVNNNPDAINAAKIYSFPILVSKNDVFNISLNSKSSSDSSFVGTFGMGFYLEGKSGTNYAMIELGIVGPDEFQYQWNVNILTLAEQARNVTWDNPGSTDLTKSITYNLDALTNSNKETRGVPPFPEDGKLYVFITGYNNNTSRRADVDSIIKNIQFGYKFYVNESLLIESQQHTANVPIQSLNELQQNQQVDDSPKYNSIGAIYDSADDNVRAWLSDFVSYPTPLGELNTKEQIQIEGEGRRVISGLFRGAFDMPDVLTFDGGNFIATRLTQLPHRNEVEGEFAEFADAVGIDYEFKYNFKTNL